MRVGVSALMLTRHSLRQEVAPSPLAAAGNRARLGAIGQRQCPQSCHPRRFGARDLLFFYAPSPAIRLACPVWVTGAWRTLLFPYSRITYDLVAIN